MCQWLLVKLQLLMQEHDTGKFERAHKEQKQAARLTSGKKKSQEREQATLASRIQSLRQYANVNDAFGAVFHGHIQPSNIVKKDDQWHIMMRPEASPEMSNGELAPVTLSRVPPVQCTAAGGVCHQRVFYVARPKPSAFGAVLQSALSAGSAAWVTDLVWAL